MLERRIHVAVSPWRRARCLAPWAWLTLPCAMVACAHAPEPVAPSAPAPPRPRPFVAPYSYEYFVRAELLAAKGRFADAAEAYRMALAGGDDDAYLLARLAEALDQSGEQGAARAVLDDAVRLDPGESEAWMARGRIAERRGETAEALAAYERAESAAPDAAAPVLASARVLREGGHHERALAVLERFAARDVVGAHHAARARLELAMMRGDGAELAAAVEEALALSPPDRGMLLRAGAALLAGRQGAAAARLLSGLAPGPKRDRLYLEALLAARDFAAAELLLLETRNADLRTPERRATVQLALGQPERALEALEAAEQPPTPAEVRLRAEALTALGRPADAALLLSTIPPSSKEATAARHSLAAALEAAGRPALAAELQPP